jgi:hypothetical protein
MTTTDAYIYIDKLRRGEWRLSGLVFLYSTSSILGHPSFSYGPKTVGQSGLFKRFISDSTWIVLDIGLINVV